MKIAKVSERCAELANTIGAARILICDLCDRRFGDGVPAQEVAEMIEGLLALSMRELNRLADRLASLSSNPATRVGSPPR